MYIFRFFHLDSSLWHEIGDLESEFIQFFQNQESLTEKISHFSWKIGYFGHFWPSFDHCNDVRRDKITIWWYLLVFIRIHILLNSFYNFSNTCTMKNAKFGPQNDRFSTWISKFPSISWRRTLCTRLQRYWLLGKFLPTSIYPNTGCFYHLQCLQMIKMVKFGLKMTIFATESKILPQFFNAEPSLVIYKGINC